MSDRKSVGFVGLGSMGEPMASNLLTAGFALRVFNRTAEKAGALVEKGAESAATPADAAPEGGVVVTMVSDDAALDGVTLGKDGVVEGLGEGGIHLTMSTVAPATSRRLAALHRECGQHYLAAPVFGRPDAAAAAKLWICLAGDPGAADRVRPLLDAMGQGVFEFGDEPSAANVVKLSGNFLIAAATEAMAEAFTLAEKNGIRRESVHELFSSTLFACPIYQGYGQRSARKEYEPAAFGLPLGLKDVTLTLGAAHESQVPMPLASLLHDRLLSALAKGGARLDWTGLAKEVSDDAGLE
ncbi:MAG TPA: NAD(P)-dependent oxidoreductase [Longimicrobiaceae bacterium]|nr:NAD(P)-dependent oxidoreductase [Longimicrobiaceae bacterium]